MQRLKVGGIVPLPNVAMNCVALAFLIGSRWWVWRIPGKNLALVTLLQVYFVAHDMGSFFKQDIFGILA